MAKEFESVYGPARTIREGDLLLRQELVANQPNALKRSSCSKTLKKEQ